MPPLHRPRAALPVEQGVLLWCLRAWAAGPGTEAGKRRPESMLEWLGAAGAAPPLQRFLHAVEDGALRPVGVAPLFATRLSLDERALLDALALAQARRPFEALLLLRGLLGAEAACAALQAAQAVGIALAEAGRFLPAPEAEVSQFAFAAGTARSAGVPLH